MPTVYFLIGMGFTLSNVIFYKKLRVPKVYWTLFMIAFVLFVWGVLNYSNPVLKNEYGSMASLIFVPFFQLVVFGILRKLFVSYNGNEPIIKNPYSTLQSQVGEYRKLHFGDLIFSLGFMFLPWVIIMIISLIF